MSARSQPTNSLTIHPSKFDDPDVEERVSYAHYWQNKLKKNDSIQFPDELVQEFAQATSGFSFAYLKEAL